MAKKAFPAVIETKGSERGTVHGQGGGIAGLATLCGMSDIGGALDYGVMETKKRINCSACLEIISMVHEHRKPANKRPEGSQQ